MRAQRVFEEVIFNMDKPSPYKRYIAKRGTAKGPKIPNPNKNGWGGGLSQSEIEISNRYRAKIDSLRNEISSLEDEIERDRGELQDLTEIPFSDTEREEFYSDVQNDYGFRALDILNSGMSDEEKLREIDALNPKEDLGIREFKDLLHNYNFYHPEEPDQEKIDNIEKKIGDLEKRILEKENQIEKLETKIYNLETY
jgi:hypothetical protein